jgi:hypothetical protein
MSVDPERCGQSVLPGEKTMALWTRLLLSVLCVLPAWHAWAAPEKNEVRVLIDISGSMKQNDPQNLRRPALRMLVGLLQPGTRAGVWTFARWSNPLIPLGEVDKDWKARALKLSEQIRSPGQFTHIERVLRDATRDIDAPSSSYNRHLVLLTDGMVDVSKQPGESAASRQRILDEILPRLKQLGIRVHTIALSERADHDLMKRLSEVTGGWYQQVDSAEQLSRVFLKVFEQVGRPDGVPLKDNRFTVDPSVKEATILLFRKPGSADPVLISPAGERYTDSDLVAGVAWYRDQGYDLITIASPKKGEWRLLADVDPDNRVMIVTDLKLQTSEVPAHLAVGEELLLSAYLSNKGKLVDRRAFLRLLDVRADAITRNGSDPLGLNDEGRDGDSKAGDGRYAVRYHEKTAFDEVELLFSVDSPTFVREKRYRLAVHEPASLRIEGEGDAARAVVEVNGAVMQDGATVTVWQLLDGQRELLEKDAKGYVLADPAAPVYLKIEGKSRLGNRIAREYGPVYVPGVEPPKEPAPTAESTAESAQVQPEAAPVEAAVQEEAAEEESGWVLPAVVFGAVNLLLIGGGLGVWWFLRRRRDSSEEVSLSEEIEAVEAELAEAEPDGVTAEEADGEPQQALSEGGAGEAADMDAKGEAA